MTCNVASAEDSISTTDAISQNFEGELDKHLTGLRENSHASIGGWMNRA